MSLGADSLIAVSSSGFTKGAFERGVEQRDIIVEQIALGESSVVHDASRITILIDLSTFNVGYAAILPIQVRQRLWEGRDGS